MVHQLDDSHNTAWQVTLHNNRRSTIQAHLMSDQLQHDQIQHVSAEKWCRHGSMLPQVCRHGSVVQQRRRLTQSPALGASAATSSAPMRSSRLLAALSTAALAKAGLSPVDRRTISFCRMHVRVTCQLRQSKLRCVQTLCFSNLQCNTLVSVGCMQQNT